jgi:hypothetical protein
MKTIYCCLVLCLVKLSESQAAIDSLYQHADKQDKIVLIANLDRRFSWLKNYDGNTYQKAHFWGGRAGLNIKNNFRTGIGYYFLKQRTDNIQTSIRYLGVDVVCNNCFSKRKIDYGVLFFEPIWIQEKYWELSTPVEAGYGYAFTHIYQPIGNSSREVRQEKGSFFPTGASLSLTGRMPYTYQGKPWRWFGLNGSIGYRKILKDNLPNEEFSGMYYSARIVFFLGRFFEDYKIWHHQRSTLKNTP